MLFDLFLVYCCTEIDMWASKCRFGFKVLQTPFIFSPLLSSGKGRGKKKKGAVPRPPPLLLIQDAEAAVTRLQERVSALLLRNPPPSPPTPTRRPSALSGWSGAAPLWQKSSLLEAATMRLCDFYVPELSDFITPCESATVRPKKNPHTLAHINALFLFVFL